MCWVGGWELRALGEHVPVQWFRGLLASSDWVHFHWCWAGCYLWLLIFTFDVWRFVCCLIFPGKDLMLRSTTWISAIRFLVWLLHFWMVAGTLEFSMLWILHVEFFARLPAMVLGLLESLCISREAQAPSFSDTHPPRPFILRGLWRMYPALGGRCGTIYRPHFLQCWQKTLENSNGMRWVTANVVDWRKRRTSPPVKKERCFSTCCVTGAVSTLMSVDVQFIWTCLDVWNFLPDFSCETVVGFPPYYPRGPAFPHLLDT